jgi:hypothetical protein
LTRMKLPRASARRSKVSSKVSAHTVLKYPTLGTKISNLPKLPGQPFTILRPCTEEDAQGSYEMTLEHAASDPVGYLKVLTLLVLLVQTCFSGTNTDGAGALLRRRDCRTTSSTPTSSRFSTLDRQSNTALCGATERRPSWL